MNSARLHPFLLFSLLIALLVAMPVVSVLGHLGQSGESATWTHLAQTVLPEYLSNTLYLCLVVGCGAILVGVATAWLTAMHDFPGRRFFEWALVLPLAMPAYVLAYLYTDLLQFVGPIQTWLRETWDWSREDYWFPEVRSPGGAAAMFICVLYPYIYLLARTAFLERASGMLEASRSLGLGPWRSFFSVSLPLARPAVAAGAALVLMEVLADYGTVAYFAVPTFTTGIYRAWFSLGDRIAAAQLAAALLGFVVLFLSLERLARGRARFHDTTGRNRPAPGRRLRGGAALAAWLSCFLPFLGGFLLPAALLLRMAFTEGDVEFDPRFIGLAGNSFVVAGAASLAAVMLALFLGYGARLTRGRLTAFINRLVGLGYAVPGSVIAVGVLIPVTRLDNWLAGQWEAWFGVNPGLLLTGGVAALVYAYLVRFMAIALQTVETGLSRITPNMDAAARSLGLGQLATLGRVHLPMLRGSLLTAALLVFVDTMKELPATLVMRPFNFDTLATQTYILASDERLTEASTAALAIVAVGLLPLIILARQIAIGRRV
ncbi:MAG: iron ABC transporter permease [Sterolibacterium sp.]|nr:iron ABC transporter permease [Sterolibacterium sp.]